ncbi:MAG: leucine-rich repeat protein [Clostridia bacterium]|nr:leucine-rich repeat protein [Clostridia bacterium]
MKKIMSLVLAVTLLVSVFGGVAVFATDAVVETVTKEILEGWGYTVEKVGTDYMYGWKVAEGVLDIYYAGTKVIDYTDSNYIDRPWNSQINDITSVIIKGTPAQIGKYTFSNMKGLTAFTLAGTETVIGACAFANTSIGGVVTIPEHITKVHGQAFMNCPINVLVYDGDAETPTLGLDKGIQYLGKLTNIVIKRNIEFYNLPTESNGRTLKHFAGTYGSGKHGMTNPAKINVVSTDAKYFNYFKTITAYPDAYDVQGKLAKEDGLAPELFKDCVVADAEKTIGINKFIDNVWYLEYYEPDGSKTIEFITNGTEKGTNMASGKALDGKETEFGKMVFGFGFTQIPEKFGIAYKSLKELKLPTTMVKIGDFAFDKVGTMVKANFEDTKITHIGTASFRNSKFKELRFPTTLIHVNQKAFVDNNALECVYFPKASNLFLGDSVFARQYDTTSSYVGKNLKVIFGDVTFNASTNLNTFAPDDATSTNWRKTTIIYDSSKTKIDKDFNQTTNVANVYYEVSDTDKDNNINLFMCDFSKNQSYKLFMCTYEGTALDKLHAIKEDTLAKGEFINMEFDTSGDVKTDKTKVFLWEGFSSCKPLVPALLNSI